MLKTGIAAVGMLGLTSSASAGFKEIPTCLQLYSIGGVGDDPPKRFAELAAMGYKGVEYAGFGGHNAKELRKFQDDAGLFCNGSHSGRDAIENLDNLKGTLDFHKELGAKFIICPGMGNDGIDGWKQAGENFAKAAEIAKTYGMFVGYHAHQPDFDIIDEKNGLSSWEIFADASGDDVMLQIDLGHCVNKGADPYALIENIPEVLRLHISRNLIVKLSARGATNGYELRPFSNRSAEPKHTPSNTKPISIEWKRCDWISTLSTAFAVLIPEPYQFNRNFFTSEGL